VSVRTLAAIAIVLGAATAADSQSLGQVAEQEAARRQRVASGKQYTNDNLKPESRSAGAEPVAAKVAELPAAAPDATPAAPPAAATAEAAEKPLVKEHRTEAYWRGRTKELRGHIQRLQNEIKVIEGQLETLAEQPGPAAEMELTQTALTRLRTNLQSFTAEFERFQARGRRANVPADWLQ
jgi:hypothetical protein